MKPYAVFVGLPGTGKSTVARELGSLLHIDTRDADDLIVEKSGQTIPEIFDTVGETGFRALEAEVITEALETFPGILSLGGGAVITPAVRRALRGHRVIHVRADDDVLLERLTRHVGKRPLIDEDPEGRLRQLRQEREPFYQQVATHTFTSDAQPVEHLVNEVAGVLEGERDTSIDVGDYHVHVGHGLSDLVRQYAAGASQTVIIHPSDLESHAHALENTLASTGLHVSRYLVPNGEEQKSVTYLAQAWEHLGELKVGRDGLIIGLGGGATTDLAGFIAASWLRGIDLLQVPTSLLGMVDAAVGGKTGIDISAGKNLVGAFHKPIGVIVDIDYLQTLPHTDVVAGMGEIIKCGWIQDSEILSGSEHADLSRPETLTDLIRRAISVKADIVVSDFKESGQREFLNYGHTLAHAIEKCENFGIKHGHAVAIGSVFAAELAEVCGVAEPGLADQHRQTLTQCGLPVSYRPGRRDELVLAMMSDKKVRDGKLRFVVLSAQGRPRIIQPTPDDINEAFQRVGA